MSGNIVEINKTQFSSDRWAMNKFGNGYVSFTRVGHHLIYDKIDQYGRWLMIPFNEYLEKGHKYVLYMEIKTNFSKDNLPVYVMNTEKKHQHIGYIDILENETTGFGFEFEAGLEKIDRVMMTATSFPISGEKLIIKGMDLEELNKF